MAPVTPDCTTVQLKPAPDTLLDKAMEELAPEQIDWDDGVAIAEGVGFTKIVTGNETPLQLFANGVTVYMAEP